MKTLKHTSQNIVAIVTEKTVYLANTETLKIYKQFGLSTFNQAGWEEIEPISNEAFEEMFSVFKSLEDDKKAARLKAAEKALIVAYETRKEEINNLWNWRKGRIDAYIIDTYVQLNNDNSSNPEGYTSELVFGEENAKTRFEELKESETPSWDMKSNNCHFVTEILYFLNEPKSRLEIVSLDELKKAIYDDCDSLERNEYAPSIEEYDYIITFNKYNRFHNATYRGTIRNIEERRTWSGWIGDSHYSAQRTSADLGFDQLAVTLDELHEEYYDAAVEFGIIKETEE